MTETETKNRKPTLPLFITFTGADARTNVGNMRWISDRYPVEWGILFSRSRQGNENRYPDMGAVMGIMGTGGLRLASHFCGEMAREIMGYAAGDPCRLPMLGTRRVQINHPHPSVAAAQRFGQMEGKRCILQCRGATFPYEHDVDWLYDVSGGNGVRPGTWPAHPGKLVGYAGGINASNVLDTIESINGLMGRCGPYWLDMESGVRTDDWFDLEKVREICSLVYGDRSDG